MSDYISKSALIEEFYKRIGGDLHVDDVEYLERVVNSIPTVDEKEIIRKPIERIKARLEEESYEAEMLGCKVKYLNFNDTMFTIKEEGGIE